MVAIIFIVVEIYTEKEFSTIAATNDIYDCWLKCG